MRGKAYSPTSRIALTLVFCGHLWFGKAMAQDGVATPIQPPASSPAIRLEVSTAGSALWYEGDGGTAHSDGNIEVWDLGRPQKRNKTIAMVSARLSGLDIHQPERKAEVESAVAKIARDLGGDAIVLSTLSNQAKTGDQLAVFRVMKYSNDTPPVGTIVEHDDSVLDADGNVVANGAATPIAVQKLSPTELSISGHMHSGRTILKVCVGPDGLESEVPVVVISSGFANLDKAAVSAATQSTFLPSTVDGKAVGSCANLPFQFGGHTG